MKKLLLLWLFIVAILAGCNKNIPDELQPKPEEGKRGDIEKIFNTEGGRVTTEQGVEVIVPQGVFKEEAKVILKFPNAHPELPQNAQGIRYISKPFTINIEADSLYTPIDLRIPIEEGVDPKDVVVIAIFDHPESLRTIQTDQEKLQECITLKLTEWSKNVIHAKFGAYNHFTQKGIEKKAPTNQAYHVCVVELSREEEKEKEQIEKSQRGLLRVVTAPISNPIKLSATYDIKEQDNVLVLVHGWTSSPSDCWSVFTNSIVNQGYIEGDKKQYDKILTFGYDSGRHIDENGKDFAEYIKTKLKGAKVDIVAHSMGGLVARSAIENHEVAKYVRSLITLGTPHLGTMSASVPFLVDVLGYIKNVKDTDGGRDLAYDSNFITELDANSEPSSVSYYYIAGGWPKKLPYGDGIVHLFSALRLKVYSWGEFEKSQYNGRIFIPVSHVGLHDNQEVINFVMQKFKEFADVSEEKDGALVVYYPFDGNAQDMSGTGNHGEVHGATLTTDRKGNKNSAFYFNGNNNYIRGIKPLLFPEKFTISLWFNFEEGGTINPRIISLMNDFYGTDGGFEVFTESVLSNRNIFVWYGKKPSWSYRSSNNFVETGQWYFLSVSYDGKRSSFYLNGKLILQEEYTLKYFPVEYQMNIGRKVVSSYDSWKGKIDDVRIYSKALNADEIKSLFER